MSKTRHTLTLLLTALALTLPTAAAAEEGFSDGWQPEAPASPEPQSFTGTFTDVGARAGLSRVLRTGRRGQTFDAGLRVALMPMWLGDMRLSYRFDNLAQGDDDTITLNSLGFAFAFHPLYLLTLGSDWISYVVSSTYVEGGLGGQLGVRRAAGTRELDPGFYWHWGAGFDLPLWDPDVGHALWLNVLYRNHRADFDTGAGESLPLATHTIFLGLCWRFNEAIF